MAVRVMTGRTPAAITGVSVTTKVDGYSLAWTPQPSGIKVEVWESSTNNVADATLVKTVVDTYYDSASVPSGTTLYLWVRAINDFKIVSPWNTENLEVTTTGVTLASIASAVGGAIASSSQGSAGSGSGPSVYETWARIDTIDVDYRSEFAAYESTFSAWLVYEPSNVTGTGFQTGQVKARIRLKNKNTGEYVNSATSIYMLGIIRPAPYASMPPQVTISHNQTLKIGAGGGIDKDEYQFELDLFRGRFSSALTYSQNISWAYSGEARLIA